MKKEAIIVLSGLVILILFLSLGQAAFNVKSNNIQRQYVGGDIIKGTINMSFSNEPAQSLLISNFLGNITLIELLKKNSFAEGNDYNCTIKNCVTGFLTKSPSPLTSLSLNDAESKIVGFKIPSGTNVQISSIKLSLTSDIADSCPKQFEIDVLNESKYFVQNYNYKNISCGFSYKGCFDNSLAEDLYQEAELSNSEYCEKINLPVAPAYKVGARITNSTQGSAPNRMRLYSDDWATIPGAECFLPAQTQQTQDVSCIINYTGAKRKDYFLCISKTGAASTNYKIKTEQSGQFCGVDSSSSYEFTRDYDLFVELMRFDIVNISINETTFFKMNQEGLANYIDTYLVDNYNRDCSSGCFVPLNIYADSSQTFTFSNVELKYMAGPVFSTSSLYELERAEPLLNSKYLNIDLSKADFVIPLGSKERTLRLLLGEESLISSLSINISPSFDFDLNPKIALIGIGTIFSVITGNNVTSVSWKFGDGNTQETQGKTITHRYLEEKNYTLEVEVTRNDGIKAKKSFDIFVGNAREAVNTLISRYDTRLRNISSQINAYPNWIKREIEKETNVSSLNSTFQVLKIQASGASSENYSSILNSLLALRIPFSISATEQGVLPLSVSSWYIDAGYMEAISGISGLTESKKENLKYEIINWSEENYRADVTYKVISRVDDSGTENLFTQFKIIITEKNAGKEGYLVIDYPKDAITFMRDYGQKEAISGSKNGAAIPVSGSKEVEFIIPEKIQVEELGAYISPKLSVFALESSGFVEKNERPQKAFWYYILVAIGIFVLYIILQEWYKKYYESYLFKNKDDLYNIINFIYNTRISRIGDGEIRRKLSNIGWKGEQITYSFKKIDGKRTGMLEIPIFRFFEQRKIRKEIAKRHGGRMEDTKFIKRL